MTEMDPQKFVSIKECEKIWPIQIAQKYEYV